MTVHDLASRRPVDNSLELSMLQEAREGRRDPEIVLVLLHRGEATRTVTWTEEYGDGEGIAYSEDLYGPPPSAAPQGRDRVPPPRPPRARRARRDRGQGVRVIGAQIISQEPKGRP